MQRFGLIGESLSYSYSKIIHEYLAKEFNIDMSYDLIETEDLTDINLENYDGLNVTIPYKQDIMDYLTYLDKSAQVVGCVNTIDYNQRGYNTDIFGFDYLMNKVGANELDDIVILGSGAMAQMIKNAYPAKNIVIISRSDKHFNYENVEDIKGEVLINTTPISMGVTFDQMLVSEGYIASFKAVIDLNYNPQISRFTNVAASNFIPNTNGLDMLIIQAIKAFEIWHELTIENEIFLKLKQYILDLTNPKVAIIGMPLSGKSTLHSDGIDLDLEIEKVIGMSIHDYINYMGEEEFRKIETTILNDLLQKEPDKIVLGGGAVLDFYNRLLLKDYQILYLNTDINTIKDRYKDGIRPLLKSKEDIDSIYNKRKKYYEYFKTGDISEDYSH